MALGLLGGMLAGAGQAVQENARSRIQARHDKALQELRQEFDVKQADKEWDRERKLAASQGFLEEQRRQEDRQWELSDSEADRAHETRLAGIRAASIGRGGYAPGGIEKDITFFTDQGYSPEEAQQLALTFRGRAGNPLDQLGDAIDRMGEVLGNEDLLYQLPEEEVEQLGRDYLAAQQRYREMSQGLLSGTPNSGGGTPPPDASGGDGRTGKYPQVGDMVGNPSSGPVQISTDAEYNSLPSGTVFIDPDGVTRRKP